MKYKIKSMLCILMLVVYIPTSDASVLSLGRGEAHAFSIDDVISTVFVSAPEVADYDVIDEHNVIIYAKNAGKANVMFYNDTGKLIFQKSLIVTSDINEVQDKLKSHFPNASIKIDNVGERAIISGTAESEQEKEKINRIVGELLGKNSENEKSTSIETLKGSDLSFINADRYDGVVDNIELSNTKQVNVRLTVAEVTSSFVEEIGLQWGSSLDGVFSGAGNFVSIGTKFNASEIATFISAINDERVGRVLAQPNLSVISGETASFLVGGQLPIVYKDDRQFQVEYKDFGISLDIAAKVLTDNKIRLAVSPTVSALDMANGNNDIPAFRIRRTRTTIELGNGQSFILGGLLNNEEQEGLSKIPGIGDVPILGALFRYTKADRRSSELVVIATVSLVTPIAANQINLPTFKPSSTLSRILGDSDLKSHLSRELLSKSGFKE